MTSADQHGWQRERDTTGTADAQLLDRFVRCDDMDAFATLMRRYHGLVFGVCLRTVGRRAVAEEAYQATFTVLAEHAAIIRRRVALASWLHAVAYRVARRMQRRERRAAPLDSGSEPVGPTMEPWDTLRQVYQAEVLEEEVNRLPESIREPLILRYYQGLPNADVASQLGLTVSAVEGRLKRAKARLRMKLLRRGITLPVALGLLYRARQTAVAAEFRPVASLLSSLEGPVGELSPRQPSQRSAQIVSIVQQEARNMLLRKIWWIAGPAAVIMGWTLSSLVVGQAWGDGLEQSRPQAVFGRQPVSSAVAETLVQFAAPQQNESGDGEFSSDESSFGEAAGLELPSGGRDPFSDAMLGSNFVEVGTDRADRATNNVADSTRPDAFLLPKRSPKDQWLYDNALQSVVDLQFSEAPLPDVVGFLADVTDVQFRLDRTEGLEDEDLTISINLVQVPLRTGLKFILQEQGLTYVTVDGVVLITTQERATQMLETRFYRLPGNWSDESALESVENIINNICDTANSSDGTFVLPVDIRQTRGVMVRADQQTHDTIEAALSQLKPVTR